MEVSFYTSARALEWDRVVQAIPGYSVFHCMAWGQVLSETYGYTPLYLAVHDGEETAAAPVFEVSTPFFGRKGVCLPFSDVCGPAFTSTRASEAFASVLVDLAREKGWKALEIRDARGLAAFSPSACFYEHQRDLCPDTDEMARSLRSSTRRNVEKAQRAGVEVEIRTTKAAVDEYYSLHCITRKRHGVPPQPKAFFDAIHRCLIDKGNGFVARARFQGVTVAASLYLHYGVRALYKFGASLPDRAHLRPNNLVMWEAIKWYAARGYQSLSFGRTDPNDEGLMQFKNGWGAQCREVHYCRWPALPVAGRKPRAARPRILFALARRMPIPALKLLGNIVYRYLG